MLFGRLLHRPTSRPYSCAQHISRTAKISNSRTYAVSSEIRQDLGGGSSLVKTLVEQDPYQRIWFIRPLSLMMFNTESTRAAHLNSIWVCVTSRLFWILSKQIIYGLILFPSFSAQLPLPRNAYHPLLDSVYSLRFALRSYTSPYRRTRLRECCSALLHRNRSEYRSRSGQSLVQVNLVNIVSYVWCRLKCEPVDSTSGKYFE